MAAGGYPPAAPAVPYVRALAHTVPPVMDSLGGRSRAPPDTLDARRGGPPSVPVTVIRGTDDDASGVVPGDGPMAGRLASLHGVPVEGRSPRFVGTIKALRLPAARPASASFPSPWAVPRSRQGFAPARRLTRRRRAGVLGVAATRFAADEPWRRQDLPSSRGTPIARSPCPSTPAGPRRQTAYNAVARPPRRERRGLPHWDFRGSIAWLSGSLSTLRPGRCRSGTQDSLPAAGQALPGGLRPAGSL